MALFHMLVALAALGASCTALADTDCTDPIADWKPREVLRHQLESRGWTVQRIKVDDGCYQVRGTDRLGNKVKAKYGPATLRIRSLEIEFGEHGDATDYLPPARPAAEHGRPPAPLTQGNKQ
ncbi:MAG: PepSY domain-containing protein [Pseudomonadota bacterium]